MEKRNFQPRFIIIVLIVVIIGQYISINNMKKDFDDKIKQCYDAINTSSIMHGALVNVLIEKNIFERNQLLQEVQKLSTDLNDMVEKIEKEKQQNMSPEKKEEEQKVYKE